MKLTEEKRRLMHAIGDGIEDRVDEQYMLIGAAVSVIANLAIDGGSEIKPKRVAKRAIAIAAQMDLGGCALVVELAEWVANTAGLDEVKVTNELLEVYKKTERDETLASWYKLLYEHEEERMDAEEAATMHAIEKEEDEAELLAPYACPDPDDDLDWEKLRTEGDGSEAFRTEKLQPVEDVEGVPWSMGVEWPYDD